MTKEVILLLRVNEFVIFLLKETRRIVALDKVKLLFISLTRVNRDCILSVNDIAWVIDVEISRNTC